MLQPSVALFKTNALFFCVVHHTIMAIALIFNLWENMYMQHVQELI